MKKERRECEMERREEVENDGRKRKIKLRSKQVTRELVLKILFKPCSREGFQGFELLLYLAV